MEGAVQLNILATPIEFFKDIKSPINTIAGLPWVLEAKLECSERTESIAYLNISATCNPENESNLWSCYATVDFQLVSQKSGTPNFSRKARIISNYFLTQKLTGDTKSMGISSFMKWADVWNDNNGYRNGNEVIVEAHISVQKTAGIRHSFIFIKPSFDFTVPQPRISDGVIVIGDVHLHVNKGYLAVYSPVFRAMFFSDFVERDKDEIVIKDVIIEEFVEMLNVTYPSHKPVSNENVEYLLELSNKFEVQYVMDECEDYLLRSDEVEIMTKLIWADQYRLAKLQDACIRKFKTAQEIKALSKSDKYKKLGDTTKLALLNKMFKLV
ncbi:unnamed protein product [Anisakis simplex]|uniref:BTB domain-containing protein n=1 Tax=Anisakis simplex TaxID=6269 RepID=A0A0M3IZ13_ANISI|nr:unnamed protein product [Anisakis simplex]